MRSDNSSLDHFAQRYRHAGGYERDDINVDEGSKNIVGAILAKWVEHRCDFRNLRLPKRRNVASIYRSSGKTSKSYCIADPSTNSTVDPVLPLILHAGFVSTSLVSTWSRQSSEAIHRQTSPHSTEVGHSQHNLTFPMSWRYRSCWHNKHCILSFFHQSSSSRNSKTGLVV